jgi:hypothetical protein
MAKQLDKAARDNRANQLNPDHEAYWKSRGVPAPETKPEDASGAGSAPGGQQQVSQGESQGSRKP